MKSNKLTAQQMKLKTILQPIVEGILNEGAALNPRNQKIANEILTQLTAIDNMVGKRSTGDGQLDKAIESLRSTRLLLHQYVRQTSSSIGR